MSAPQDEAAAILGHYLKTISRAAGLKWTSQNDADMQRVAELLGDGGLAEIPSFYQPDEPEQDEPPARRPARPATPGPRRSGSTPTTSTEDDRAYLRRLAASNGIAPKGGR